MNSKHGNVIHGMSRSRIYFVWKRMKNRCNSPTCKIFKHYGGRGIKVCDLWNQSFQAFYDWAMANGYRDDLSIERKNNELGYSPDNCTWIPQIAQAENRRSVLKNSAGIPWCRIAKEHGISKYAYHDRKKAGWPIEAAATLPVGSKNPLTNSQG